MTKKTKLQKTMSEEEESVDCSNLINIVKKTKREIGILEGKSKVVFAEGFQITDKDFLGL